MAFANESVTLPGSGLVFINYYDDAVTAPYRSAIIAAENFLQAHFTNSVTINIEFDLQNLGANFAGQNDFDQVNVSFNGLTQALASHATTADDLTAAAGFPTFDPSGGRGFSIPVGEAVILGLAPQTNAHNDTVTLNSSLNFTFGQDAIGVILHEITEGVFGRNASLGFSSVPGFTSRWAPLDLFRFTAAGDRDFSGGSDGVPTYFGIDSSHVFTNLQYHGSINSAGVNDGFDLGDWDHTRGDAFGPGGPSSPGFVTSTDLRLLDILGWTPTGTGHDFVPAPDDFASTLTDTTAAMGHITAGTPVMGVLQQAGDRDWFAVTLQAGATYTFTESGQHSSGGTLGDAYLRLHDASGAVIQENDDIVSGTNPDSQIVFTATTSGTYYLEAGAFTDGYQGSYTLSVSQSGGPSGSPGGGQILSATTGSPTVQAGSGDDTINGGEGPDYLRGNDGNDVILGGPAFDDINGNVGNDTAHGYAGDDWVVGGKNDDMLFGDQGDDIVLGNLGNDTLDGGDGNDVVRGGQGDDTLTGGAGADFISGDRGNDTEAGGPGADMFHSSQDAGIDKVIDFNYAEGDRVELDPGTTFTASQVGADTVLDMGGGNEVILVGVNLASLPSDWVFFGP
jgi:Ca2+-binding RTX toxin-like protein